MYLSKFVEKCYKVDSSSNTSSSEMRSKVTFFMIAKFIIIMTKSAVIFDMGGVILPSPNPAITRFEKEKRIPRGTGKSLDGVISRVWEMKERHEK